MKYDVYDLLEYVNYDIKKNKAKKFVPISFYERLKKTYPLPAGLGAGIKKGYKDRHGLWVRSTVLVETLEEVAKIRKAFFVPVDVQPRKVQEGEYGPSRSKKSLVQNTPSIRTAPIQLKSEPIETKEFQLTKDRQTIEPACEPESDETVIRSLALNDDKWGSLNKLGDYLGMSHRQVLDFVRYKQKKKIWLENIDWCETVRTSPSSQSIFEFTAPPMNMWYMACQAKGDRAEQVQRLIKEIVSGDTKKAAQPQSRLFSPEEMAQIMSMAMSMYKASAGKEIETITTTTIEKTIAPKVTENSERHDDASLSATHLDVCQILLDTKDRYYECPIVNGMMKRDAKLRFLPNIPANNCTYHKIRQKDFEELRQFFITWQPSELDYRRIEKYNASRR